MFTGTYVANAEKNRNPKEFSNLQRDVVTGEVGAFLIK